MARRPAHVATANYWPSFVDALAALVLVLVYLISAFLLVEFFLSNVIQRKDSALEELRRQIAQLGEVLALERAAGEDARTNAGRLTASLEAEGQRAGAAEEALGKMRADMQALQQALAERDERLAALDRSLTETEGRRAALEGALHGAEQKAGASQAEIAELNAQVVALRDQLRAIASALQVSESALGEKDAKIADLGQKLNVALAKRVEELSKYRSEFFGKLNAIIGTREGIRVVGDRFVFQSEVLFPIGSADISGPGRDQLDKVVQAVKAIQGEIPTTIPWVLRIDGHTDSVPIHNARFASNWELSQARAMSVVRYLIGHGVPPSRLAAAGFAEFQPLEPAKDDAAKDDAVKADDARNRRIEIKLTER